MKAIRFMQPEVIEYSEIPAPQVKDNEVLAKPSGVVQHFKAGHRDGRMRKFSLFAKSLSITSYNFINIHRILLFLSVITNV